MSTNYHYCCIDLYRNRSPPFENVMTILTEIDRSPRPAVRALRTSFYLYQNRKQSAPASFSLLVTVTMPGLRSLLFVLALWQDRRAGACTCPLLNFYRRALTFSYHMWGKKNEQTSLERELLEII